jgi:two-component system, OmpR family, sensor histidine kinase QseC
VTRVPSLQRRIVQALIFVAPLLWIASAAVALYQTRDEVHELYDGQLVMLAHQLAERRHFRHGEFLPPPDDDRELPNDDRESTSHTLAQAIWLRDGTLVWEDGEGAALTPLPPRPGFYVRMTPHGKWRVYFLSTPDGRAMVAVGQNLRMRHEAAWHVVLSQLWAWLLPLPLLILALGFAVRRGLAPLNRLAASLTRRRADDLGPIDAPVPAEAQPLIDALNTLFARVGRTMERERRFTADAAHELRTPLAALRVQAEVAQMAQDPQVQRRALDNLGVGIERASRLVDQMLALSRLDPMQGLQHAAPVSWSAIAASVLQDVDLLVQRRGMQLECIWQDAPAEVLPVVGDAALLSLMLRNLLENALRYTPPGGRVRLLGSARSIRVEDDGPGVDPDCLEKLRQRFYRPPGQSEPGSGLGLSIVERIAELHGLRLDLGNLPQGGFCACIVGRESPDPGLNA